jgi:lambda repressor-like predicted transcriptional regulator
MPAWAAEYARAHPPVQPQRKRKHTPGYVNAPKVAELRQQGWTLMAIGSELGLSRERIRKICDEHGIQKPKVVKLKRG